MLWWNGQKLRGNKIEKQLMKKIESYMYIELLKTYFISHEYSQNSRLNRGRLLMTEWVRRSTRDFRWSHCPSTLLSHYGYTNTEGIWVEWALCMATWTSLHQWLSLNDSSLMDCHAARLYKSSKQAVICCHLNVFSQLLADWMSLLNFHHGRGSALSLLSETLAK